jgi:predicted alpha/beta hydrolase
MRDVLDIFFEIVVAIAGAVFVGSAVVAAGALALGCAVFGSCAAWMGWRRRRRSGRQKSSD